MSRHVSAGARGKCLAKLQESGLDEYDAEALGLTFHDDAKQLHEFLDPVVCIRFDYRDLDGRSTGFWRVRHLHNTVEEHQAESTGFDSQTTGKLLDKMGKEAVDKRYLQPPGSVTRPYFPSVPLMVFGEDEPPADWREVAKEISVPIFITEGEFKAAKMCNEGYACIGLGGVWNFMSKGQGVSFLPEFEEVDWKGREVFIVFDTDAATKEGVILAATKLCEQLLNRGASPVWYLRLYDIEGKEKTGVDDFLVSEGRAALDELIESNNCERLVGIEKLLKYNERYAHIMLDPTHTIFDLKTGQHILEPAKWAAGLAGEKVPLFRMNSKGERSLEEVECAKMWLGWPIHRAYERMDYKPGETPYAPLASDPQTLNIWPGWAVEPIKGDLSVLWAWKKRIFGDDKEAWDYFIRWHAYPIQNPGVKMTTAVLMVGRPGSGKSSFSEAMRKIYGINAKKVDAHSFWDKFNPWVWRTQYIYVDEAFVNSDRKELSHQMSILQDMVTRPRVPLNMKFMQQREVDDMVNIFMTTNLDDALPLLEGDRRIFIHRTDEPNNPKAGKEFANWIDNGGAEALLHYLMYEVDLGDFSPYHQPPMTEGKELSIELNKTEAQMVIEDLLVNGPLIVGTDRHSRADLFEINQLWNMLSEQQQKAFNNNPSFLRRDLFRGSKAKYVPRMPKDPDGKPRDQRISIGWPKAVQVFAIRNHEMWEKSSIEDIAKHMALHDPRKKGIIEAESPKPKKGSY